MSTVTISDTPFVGNDRLLVGIVLSVLTFWLFAQSVINVVPAMISSLDISLETLTLAVSLSALFSGCFVVASGGLADKFGRMRMTTIGLGLSIVGSAMLVVAQGPGLFLAGAIATGLGWRWIFVFSIAVALLALFLLRGTPESRSASASQHKLDVGGLLSLIVALVLVNLFISKGHGWGWSSPLSLTMLAGALAAGTIFIRNGMRKGEAALIDFALFRNRAYGAAVLSNFLLNGAIGTMMIASIWLQQGHHLTPLESGMMTLGYLVTVLAMIRVGEKLLQRYGARLPMMAGPVLTAIAIALISCTFLEKALYIGVVFASNVLFGLGLGCYATPSTDTAVANAPENKIGVASGIYKMGSSLGGAMGIAVTASLFALFLPLGMAHAAQYALWFNAVLCLGAMAVSALLLPRASHS
ncbi:MFS transporter [Klebsiella pneumoniae]|uniref:MFS transporter n=1 Tax=Klebsiella pneumoniae TaxID=573 RepID=UPI000BAE0717|nr:MFS transporter [Klebsiella pneumoniae]PAX31609.1 MFS transporter [Klebsiella pneumoniae]